MKLKRFFALALSALTITSTLTACASSPLKEEKITKITDGFTDYDKVFEDGMFYVKHSDGTFEPIYFGAATYEKGEYNASTPDYQRIMWYQDDFNSIPTLYEGDEILMYSEDTFYEIFTIERYYDYGYSVGICNLEITDSGRFAIKTTSSNNSDVVYTYPNSDASEIEGLNSSSVIIDTLGGVALRDTATSDKVNGSSTSINTTTTTTNNAVENSFLTKAGTIGGLVQDSTYVAEVYAGTVKKTLNLKANVRVLGEFETYTITDYDYVASKCIRLNIPEEWNEGFYCINGLGIFRYVKGESYDENTDFNIANVEVKSTSTSLSSSSSSDSTDRVVVDGDVYVPYSDGETKVITSKSTETIKYEYLEPKVITINVSTEGASDAGAVSGTATLPTGETIELTNKSGTLTGTFTTTASTLSGTIYLEYTNLSDNGTTRASLSAEAVK